MARTPKEWIGKSDDAKIPPRVKQRVYDRENGSCHICKLPIKVGESWDADHVIALINGGEHREANLKPAHKHCHMEKTASDVAEKAKVAKKRQKHLGITRAKQTIKSRGFPTSPKAAKRQEKTSLPPRRLYQEARHD